MNRTLSLLIAFLAICIGAFGEMLYTATPIESPIVGGATAGNAINSSGEVTGSFSFSSNNTTHPFLYSNGATTDLGFNGVAWGINDSGQIVGYSGGGAFVYSNGSMTNLGILPGGFDSIALGINNSGQIVGYSSVPGSTAHAFLYSNGIMTDIGPGNLSEASAINNSGEVTGWFSSGGAQPHAFLYSNGVTTDLGTLPGSVFTYAYGINDSGDVVGTSGGGTAFGHAFLYSNGMMLDIGTLPGSDESTAYGINDSGQIVGDSIIPDVAGEHAFVYSNGVMTDLNSVIVNSLSGYTLLRATAINNSGQIIAQGASSGPRPDETFLLTPVAVPEPSTVVLSAGALCAFLVIRRPKRRKHALQSIHFTIQMASRPSLQ